MNNIDQLAVCRETLGTNIGGKMLRPPLSKKQKSKQKKTPKLIKHQGTPDRFHATGSSLRGEKTES